MLVSECRDPPLRPQVGIALQDAALAAIGLEGRHFDPARYAGLATTAMGPIDMSPGAPETAAEGMVIDASQIRRERIDDQIPRQPVGKIAATVVQGLEQPNGFGAHGEQSARTMAQV